MDELEGEFIIREGGEIKTYDKVRDLPASFDHLIKFAPSIPEPPHTEEQHTAMGKYSDNLQSLMSRER